MYIWLLKKKVMKDILKLFVFLFFTISLIACKPKPQGKVETVKFTDEYRKNLIDSFRRVDSIRKIKDSIFRSAPITSIEFKETLFNFGDIKSGDIVTHNFVFYNTGKNPLIINSAMGSCGCTVPSYPETPIAPGDSAEMKVVFNSTGKSGPTTKSVTIVANTEPQISELNISANIAKEKKKPKKTAE